LTLHCFMCVVFVQENKFNPEVVEHIYEHNPILRYTQSPLYAPLLPFPYGSLHHTRESNTHTHIQKIILSYIMHYFPKSGVNTIFKYFWKSFEMLTKGAYLLNLQKQFTILIYFKMLFIPVMAKLNFQHHYSSLQCHMILQKSFWYADLLLKKHFLLMLKTVLLLNTFKETFFQDSLIKRKFKRTAFIWNRNLL